MANPEIENYVSVDEVPTVLCEYPFEAPHEREARFRKCARDLLFSTLVSIRNMGYDVESTNTNSDVDVKANRCWFTLTKIK